MEGEGSAGSAELLAKYIAQNYTFAKLPASVKQVQRC
jgi:hypothetical protein